MNKYVINGGKPLSGRVDISGAKNAAVAILPAALLVEGICRIDNIPNISDVNLWLSILQYMGARIKRLGDTEVEIDSTDIRRVAPPYDLMRKMRASYYLVGAMLGRFGWAEAGMPGGCDFGERPIDQHIKGFRALGAKVEVRNGAIHAVTENGIRSGHVFFDKRTVGATINVMIAAACAPGQTVIENANKEPHIVDVANFLNSMGADIRGAGTDLIKIRGRKLHGGSYSIIPDQIEAGTFIAAVAATGGDVIINNIIPKHLECITTKFAEIGVDISEGDEYIRVSRPADRKLRPTHVTALPYPGYPTDMQPQIASCLCLANGTSFLTDGVYENRFRYVDELRRMGADITVDGKTAVIRSVKELTGAPISACDLRAGVAMIIAGLSAKGRTEIDGIEHIERGYQDIVSKFRSIGADISIVEYPDGNEVSAVV
ncbi:MAG: UDP-N-acetylglucosamine 1-carboxyvinyltransferase [Clostridiales bacterium]|nr:UDP-N-acetylglucosamine 1-carboxyvinyltransferase [Clostridiales bacterium]